jgi:hypothetical protein
MSATSPDCRGGHTGDQSEMKGLRALTVVSVGILLLLAGAGCASVPASPTPTPTARATLPERESRIPADAVKVTAETDEHPPLAVSSEFNQPVPLPPAIDTAGAEDSPFILPDGNTLYFFFTPDVRVPVERQVIDGVSGIYVSHRVDGTWHRPERVVLERPGMAAGDGCAFVLGNTMWFCSVREGFTGVHWFTATEVDGVWRDWQLADFAPDLQVGELHMSSDGDELYFGSDRVGGKGGLDIWMSQRVGGEWQAPLNIAAVNTEDSEGWPALNPAGDELWFSRNFGVWRARKVNGAWGEPELIVSPLAGEPSVDGAGNLYFVHHFYSGETMIEADIYMAARK